MNLVIGNVKYRGRDLPFLTESPFFFRIGTRLFKESKWWLKLY